MTTKRRYEWINHLGQVTVTDEDVCPSGFGVRAPVLLMDAKQNYQPPVRIVDAWGGRAGSRPGYCFDSGPSAESVLAYDAMTQRLNDAWRAPSAVEPANLTKDEAFALMGQRLEDAWKLTQMPPGFINERTGKYEANATGEAVEGRQFYRVEQDGTDLRDAAYRDHVRALSEQWRTR